MLNSQILTLCSQVRLLVLFMSCFAAVATASAGSQEKLVKITPRKEKGKTVFQIANLTAAPVTVSLELTLENLTCSQQLPWTTTLDGHATNTTIVVSPADSSKDSSWSYTYYATWGSLTATNDEAYVYSLPFAPGKSYPVSQGYNGEFSHKGCDQYAIDWRMPVGTPVHAAREGVVVAAKDDSQSGGADKKYEWDANYILIQHSDGTLGHYVHLSKGGNRVKVGQTVHAGDWIGLSGNTGRSTGPHLHFAVFKAHDGRARETLPVKYRTSDAVIAVLKEGNSYTGI